MSSRSAKLVRAALRNENLVDEEISVPSTSGIQNFVQESSEEVWSYFDSDDSVLDKDYEPPKSLNRNISNCSDSDSDADIIPCSQPIQHRTVLESPEHSDGETNQNRLTKKGNIRKRKTFDVSLKDRKRLKKEKKSKPSILLNLVAVKTFAKKSAPTVFQMNFAKKSIKIFGTCHGWNRNPFFCIILVQKNQIDRKKENMMKMKANVTHDRRP